MAVLVLGLLMRVGLAALGSELDVEALSCVLFLLFWHCVLLF